MFSTLCTINSILVVLLVKLILKHSFGFFLFYLLCFVFLPSRKRIIFALFSYTLNVNFLIQNFKKFSLARYVVHGSEVELSAISTIFVEYTICLFLLWTKFRLEKDRPASCTERVPQPWKNWLFSKHGQR